MARTSLLAGGTLSRGSQAASVAAARLDLPERPSLVAQRLWRGSDARRGRGCGAAPIVSPREEQEPTGRGMIHSWRKSAVRVLPRPLQRSRQRSKSGSAVGVDLARSEVGGRRQAVEVRVEFLERHWAQRQPETTLIALVGDADNPAGLAQSRDVPQWGGVGRAGANAGGCHRTAGARLLPDVKVEQQVPGGLAEHA